MERIGWQDITKRFSHLDAYFVRSEIGFPDNDGFYTVEFYPWWEHPLYQEAVAEAKPWGFIDYSEGFREVTVYPKGVREVLLSRDDEVTDWDFTQEHPALWKYENSGTILCNSPLTVEKWLQIAGQVQDRLTGYNREAAVVEYALAQVQQWGHHASFTLGMFPYTLYTLLCSALDSESVPYFSKSQPEPSELPVLFLIDDADYIIADDFEIEVPEFEHKPEWFHPA